MPTDSAIIKRLFESGFIASEVRKLLKPMTPDGKPQDFMKVYHSQPFQDMMRSRSHWKNSLKSRGYTDAQIAKHISGFYHLSIKPSPWDFVKSEYKPMTGNKPVSDFVLAVRKRAQEKTRKLTRGTRSQYPYRLPVSQGRDL